MTNVDMKTKKRLTVSGIILAAVCSLLPLCALGIDIILLLANTVFTPAYVLTWILPVMLLILLWALGLSKIKFWGKFASGCGFLLSFTILFLTVCSWGQFAGMDHYSQDAVEKSYAKFSENLETMPTLDEIGEPIKVDYYDYYASAMIFTWESDILLCTYDEQEYKEQKELLDQTYIFQTEDMEECGYACSPYAEVDGFAFRVLSFDEYKHLYYPKYMTLIGTNDETNQIVYILFDDPDRDYISSSLAEFIKEESGWKYIQRRKLYFG